ncbi:MAG: acetyl-CoA carboxylase biotin carboxyl carrier protein subunit [Bryobacterales bacterium]|nr:acetyl-CoA carboxylase biotin carboxyl carrier protein subunit [Bryobacterales bacterium]
MALHREEHPTAMKRLIQANGRSGSLDFTRDGTHLRFHLTWDDGAHDTGLCEAVESAPGVWSLLWEGQSFEAILEPGAVIVNGTRIAATSLDPRNWSPADAHAAASGPAHITAPMPGKLVRVLVAEGDTVEEGQGIAVVEAMKMQNEMQAPRAGIVRGLRAAPGATVAAGEVLATIE